MRQLTLDLTTHGRPGLDGIIDHAGIHSALTSLRSIISRQCVDCPTPVLIHGAAGSGKTAILRAFTGSAVSTLQTSEARIILIEPQLDSNRFPDLEQFERAELNGEIGSVVLAVDDVHKLNGDDSYCFWSIYNKLNRVDGMLVMTSRLHPSEMFPGNDHLRSRLMAGLVIGIASPDDSARIRILDRMAQTLGFRLSHEVCSYLIKRKSRNLKELEQILKLLDSRSLETRRRVTIPLVKEMEQEGLI